MAALATHRGLLERHRAALSKVLMAAVEGEPPMELVPEMSYPDFIFFMAEPSVKTRMVKDGVE